MLTPLLKEAYEIISKEIELCKEAVKADEFCSFFCQEKEQHSFQVLSAGKYILKGIKKTLSEEQKDLYSFAALLHDVGRFKEIKLMMNNRNLRHDHGRYSMEKLVDLGYADKTLLLAILHHGHMLSDFYQDKDYLLLSEEKKQATEKLLFFVRDADKIANLKLFVDKPETGMMEEGRLPKRKDASPEIVQAFTEQRIADYSRLFGLEDWYFARLSWIFELHYAPSFSFIRQYDLVERHLAFLSPYVDDKFFLEFCKKQLNLFIDDHSCLEM